MFDIGWSEMLIIAVVAIVVVGPKDLPRMLRQVGRTTAKLRAMAGDFRRQFDEALKEAELEDVSETLNSVRKINPVNEIRKHLTPIEEVGRDVRAGLDAALKPSPPPTAPASDPVAAEPLKTGATEMPAEAAAQAAPLMTPLSAAAGEASPAAGVAPSAGAKAPAKPRVRKAAPAPAMVAQTAPVTSRSRARQPAANGAGTPEAADAGKAGKTAVPPKVTAAKSPAARPARIGDATPAAKAKPSGKKTGGTAT